MKSEISNNTKGKAVSFIESWEVGKKVPDATFNRRLRIENDKGEHSLNTLVVVEDFRVGLYLSFLILMIVGVILTNVFTEVDENHILVQVYGVSNLCKVFDFAPSTYVIPALWWFAQFSGILYSIAAIFRIQVSYLEMKLSRCAAVSLIIVYVYVVLSLVYFSVTFAVQPDPKYPVTMVVHTIPYINLKMMFCVLQAAIVYFGIKVSWVGLNFPRWFYIGSIIHVIVYIVVTIAGTVWIANALGNMGASLEGKGLWWSVRGETSKLFGDIVVNYLGFILGFVLPFFHSLYICRKGMDTHALVVVVSDNRVTAYNEDHNL